MESQRQTRGQILLNYVRMRRSGVSKAEALEKIKPDVFLLAQNERHLLGTELDKWEGEQPKPAPSDPAQKDAAQPSPDADSELSAQAVLNRDFIFGVQNLDQAKAPAATSELPQLCPKCKKKNKFAAEFCAFCGAPLKAKVKPTLRIARPPDIDRKAKSTGQVYLAIKGHKQPIELYVRQEMVLGRSSPGSSLKPEIDLAPYDAEALGVSRSHATLKNEGDTIVLTDLESSNLTLINGAPLYPHEKRVLRHGDEIQLGKLTMKVMFKL